LGERKEKREKRREKREKWWQGGAPSTTLNIGHRFSSLSGHPERSTEIL
jgi:hypothetical protein